MKTLTFILLLAFTTGVHADGQKNGRPPIYKPPTYAEMDAKAKAKADARAKAQAQGGNATSTSEGSTISVINDNGNNTAASAAALYSTNCMTSASGQTPEVGMAFSVDSYYCQALDRAQAHYQAYADMVAMCQQMNDMGAAAKGPEHGSAFIECVESTGVQNQLAKANKYFQASEDDLDSRKWTSRIGRQAADVGPAFILGFAIKCTFFSNCIP